MGYSIARGGCAGVEERCLVTAAGNTNFVGGLEAEEEEVVGGRRCVLRNTASEGVRGMSRSGRLAASEEKEDEDDDEPGKSKALKTEGLLSSKNVWLAAAGAVG